MRELFEGTLCCLKVYVHICGLPGLAAKLITSFTPLVRVSTDSEVGVYMCLKNGNIHVFAINPVWSKSISLSPHDFQNELLEILPLTALWHGVKSGTYQFQNVILLYRKWWGILPITSLSLVLQVYATAGRGILRKHANLQLLRASPKLPTTSVVNASFPLCYVESLPLLLLGFFQPLCPWFLWSFPSLPIFVELVRTMTSESSQHFLFTDGFMTLPSENMFGEINLACFKPKWMSGND